MENFLTKINLDVGREIYLKDPQSSALGKKIISGSIDLLEELGLEDFTFKKLADQIDSTEASIYRYFDNKYRLLLYLTAWYWAWMEYKIVFATVNISSPQKRLEIAVEELTQPIVEDSNFSHINEIKLNNIVIAESTKSYFSKNVDKVNEMGAFSNYKQLVERVSSIILEINDTFKYPRMLVSSVIEGAHFQRYFAEHLPGLTDVVKGEDAVSTFYLNLVFKTIAYE